MVGWERSVMLCSLNEIQEPLSPLSMCVKMSMKMPRHSRAMAVLILLFACLCTMADASTRIGGIRDVPDVEHKKDIQDLGRFAVNEYNMQQNVGILFSKVVKAQEQVVSGLLYFLTIKTKDGSKTKLYAAKVWVKPWAKFKQLQEFKPVQTLY